MHFNHSQIIYKIISNPTPFFLPVNVNEQGDLQGCGYRALPKDASSVEERWGHQKPYGMGWTRTISPSDSWDTCLSKMRTELENFVCNHLNERVVVLIGGDFDQWGPQANFGRGVNGSEPPDFQHGIVDTLQKLAKNQASESTPVFYLGTPTDKNIDSSANFSQKATEYGFKIESILKMVASVGSTLPILIHGGHNLNKDFQKGLWEGRGVFYSPKFYEIQLDRHGDCRLDESNGRHSGSHNRELRELEIQGDATFLGIHKSQNNRHNKTWMAENHIDIHYISNIRSSSSFEKAVQHTIDRAKESGMSVVITICGDTINGYPSSAGSNINGIDYHDVLFMIHNCCAQLGDQLIGINILEGNKRLALRDHDEASGVDWKMKPQDMAEFHAEVIYEMVEGLHECTD